MSSSLKSVALFIIWAISVEIVFGGSKNVIYRLPNNTIPEHYNIQISTKLEMDDFMFSGICTIGIKVLKETKEIVLHSKMADIERLELLSSIGDNITIAKNETNYRNEFLTISLNEKLAKRELYYLKIWYSSTLRSDKLGFYRSSYSDHLGKKVWLAATQFAPTEARHAFPCYDEPNQKATFQLEITHPSELKAISGTEPLETKPNSDGTITTKFEKTEVMSTYLLGFVISNFEKVIEQKHHPEVQHELYVRPNKLLRSNRSVKFAGILMDALTDCFEENFPQPIMKHVALPDFFFSGMENWGMVSYKESKFLYDQTKHTANTKAEIISLIGHEMAHSWFGNLVTMEWWTYVWLKEGFSTLYAYYGAQVAFLVDHYLELFQIQKMHTVLLIDGSTKTRPMTHYVEKQDEIMKNYDKIAYNKAASVLRMWDNAFGHDVFEKAVNIYLKKFKFKNADEENLIDCFAEAMPTNSREYMEKNIKSWTQQKGFPVVTVLRDDNSRTISLTQERFMNNGDREEATVWRIPINFKKSKTNDNFESTKPDVWMVERTLKLKGTMDNGKNVTLDPDEWIIFNKQQTGFYRVNYDLKNWELITQALKEDHNEIHVLNRAQLIDDSFALAAAEKLNFSVPLNLIAYMGRERYYAPWAALDTNFKDFKRHLRGPPLDRLYKYILNIALEYIIQKDKPDYRSGIGDGPFIEQLTDNIVYELICKIDINRCPNEKTDPNRRFMSYCSFMHNKGKDAYLEIRRILRTEDDLNVRRDLLSSLGCSKDKKLLSLFLLSTIERPSDLRLTNEERKHLLESIYLRGELGLEMAIKFISREYVSIHKLIPDALNNIIPDIAKYVHTHELKETFDSMIEKITNILKSDTIITAKSEVTSNLRWALLYNEDVNKALKSAAINLHFAFMWTIVSLCILAFFR